MQKIKSMKYVVAIDSFKECLTSSEANEAVRSGIVKTDPCAEVDTVMVSDGGEGFLDAMCPDSRVRCHAHDAMMRPVEVEYGLSGTGSCQTAVIEVARVVGLEMIEPELRNPLRATSYGLGEVVADAWRRGCRQLIVGLGGSAVSDCGIGMLRALKKAIFSARRLPDFAAFDTTLLQQLQVTLATDVTAPLLGDRGAARVFAPQKGATPEMVDLLERKAATFAEAAARHQQRDCRQQPGAGAAGGLGYAFMEFMNAKTEAGAGLVLRHNGFDERLKGCRCVFTGEGHADRQTLMGKLPAEILRHAQAAHIPVVLLAGRVDGADVLLQQGFEQVMDINAGCPADIDPLCPDVARERLQSSVARLLEADRRTK